MSGPYDELGAGASGQQASIDDASTLAVTHGLTDAYLADRFVARNGDNWRYDHNRKKWLVYREVESRWRIAKPGEPESLTIESARALYDEAKEIVDPKVRDSVKAYAKYAQQNRGVGNALSLMKTHQRIAVSSTDWDQDPWLVGALNGVIDLRIGELLEGSRECLISRSLAAPFDPWAECPRWESFLREVFGTGDQSTDDAMIEYIQRVLGYVLTGQTTEQVWWLLLGDGSNGKTTFLNAVARILDEYGTTLPLSYITHNGQRPSQGDGTETLIGRRFLSVRETIEGERLDEARVKTLTGSDMLSARPLYGSPFSFTATTKLFLCANYRPEVGDDSNGFWRRIKVLHFPHQFSAAHCDTGLPDALHAEAAGILKWMIQGAMEWREGGLRTPACVEAATGMYREESDTFKSFLSDCLDFSNPNPVIAASMLYDAYLRWCEAQQIPPGRQHSQSAFGSRIKALVDSKRTMSGVVYYGIELK